MRTTPIYVVILFWIAVIVCYVINFIHLISAIKENDVTMIIVKAIGALTALGSLITVWF